MRHAIKVETMTDLYGESEVGTKFNVNPSHGPPSNAAACVCGLGGEYGAGPQSKHLIRRL